MRINSTNNDQTKFTALRKVNLIGMSDLEKKVVIDSLDEIKKVANQVENMDIGLTNIPGHRSFIAHAYNNSAKSGDELILEGATSGNPHIMDESSKENWIKASLSYIVNTARDDYFRMFPDKRPTELPVYSMKSDYNGAHGFKTLL